MADSVARLLANIIDYAGLFPPAKHEMEAAVGEYAALRQGPDAWLVSRFVCPTGRLPELLSHIGDPESPWRIAAIGQGLDNLKEDLQRIDAFEREAAGRATVEAIETPAGDALSSGTLKKLADTGFEDAFVEVPWGESQLDMLHTLAESDSIFAKARTGGADKAAIPSSEELAGFLHECISLDLPFKLTAGLHHPFRQVDPTLGVEVHGFLQIAVAVAIAVEHDASRHQIAQILAESGAAPFGFRSQVCRWRTFEASVDAMDTARELFSSLGSCSVAEPVEDLAKVRLLPDGVGA